MLLRNLMPTVNAIVAFCLEYPCFSSTFITPQLALPELHFPFQYAAALEPQLTVYVSFAIVQIGLLEKEKRIFVQMSQMLRLIGVACQDFIGF